MFDAKVPSELFEASNATQFKECSRQFMSELFSEMIFYTLAGQRGGFPTTQTTEEPFFNTNTRSDKVMSEPFPLANVACCVTSASFLDVVLDAQHT